VLPRYLGGKKNKVPSQNSREAGKKRGNQNRLRRERKDAVGLAKEYLKKVRQDESVTKTARRKRWGKRGLVIESRKRASGKCPGNKMWG